MKEEKIECYAHSGVGAWVTSNDCLHCEMGMNGCPAYPYEDAIQQGIIDADCNIIKKEPKQIDFWGNTYE